jgi:hypothetical protein
VARISQIISLFALGFQKFEKSLGSIARGSDGSRMIVAGGVYGVGSEQACLRAGEPANLGERLVTNCRKHAMCSDLNSSTASPLNSSIQVAELFIRYPPIIVATHYKFSCLQFFGISSLSAVTFNLDRRQTETNFTKSSWFYELD